MASREQQSPPLTKEKPVAAGRFRQDGRDLPKQREEAQPHLADSCNQQLGPDGSSEQFESSTALVIMQAQLSLVESLSLNLRPTWFRTTKAAILQLERLKKNQRASLVEELLNRIGRLLASYRGALDDTIRRVIEDEVWNHEPTIGRGRWVAIQRPLSVGTDLAEKWAESQLEAETLYGEEFATAISELRRLVGEES